MSKYEWGGGNQCLHLNHWVLLKTENLIWTGDATQWQPLRSQVTNMSMYTEMLVARPDPLNEVSTCTNANTLTQSSQKSTIRVSKQ